MPARDVAARLADGQGQQREEPLGVGVAADHGQRRDRAGARARGGRRRRRCGRRSRLSMRKGACWERDRAGARVAQVGEQLAGPHALGDLPVGLVVAGLDGVAHEQQSVAGGQRRDAEPLGVALALRGERVRRVSSQNSAGTSWGPACRANRRHTGGDASPRSRSSSLVRVPGTVGVGVGRDDGGARDGAEVRARRRGGAARVGRPGRGGGLWSGPRSRRWRRCTSTPRTCGWRGPG